MSQPALLRELKKQIDFICARFQMIRGEAGDIMETSNMPDATMQLNDVLQHTEQATVTIIEAVGTIGSLVADSNLSEKEKSEINEQVSRVFEACNFQDISGQRIKKVLGHISDLESQLLRLSDIAKGNAVEKPQKDPLLNGPQLSNVAPSQQEIDKLFKSN